MIIHNHCSALHKLQFCNTVVTQSNDFAGISGVQFSGVSGGKHTVTVRATSTSTGLQATAASSSFEVLGSNAIFFTGISGERWFGAMTHHHTSCILHLATQDISVETVTFTFTPSEGFPVWCRIDGGEFYNCECMICVIYGHANIT